MLQDIPAEKLPRHVGIIMDGNGRWAKRHGVARNIGHKRGADAFADIARHAQKRGVAYLTVYAFSTENWKRPPEEVKGILSLLREYLKDAARYEKDNLCLRVLGDRTPLDADIRAQIIQVEQRSKDKTGMRLNIALNYGGREELTRAARLLAERCVAGEISPADIDAQLLSQALYTAGQPDVDLLIRTSGELRLSNFLLWQSAYAEFVFSDALWPDFKPADFDDALRQYALRDRRMGGR